uniref:Cytochrome b n=1 Tax=Euretidae gen. sp. DVL-2014 TaxID=1569957 RepID=A0A0N6W8Y7_9METZ|nr:apocytochrome b [Euretidae gen. sp. DVL-2014]
MNLINNNLHPWTNKRKKHFLINPLSKIFTDLPLPSNINYYWNFGSLLGLCMIIQLITGILLAMHYCPNVTFSFNSITHITRNIPEGSTLRNIHANSASIFFLCVYFHIGRNIYHSTWKNSTTWSIGIIIYIIMILAAFTGYVLPWGQMSFWAATVITNLLSATPYIGNEIVQWVWGSFSISNSTLNRFYSLHYLLPFLLLLLIITHILALHTQKQSSPTGTHSETDKLPFHQYFSLKDLQTTTILIILIFYLSTITPYLLTDPENFIKANPMITPTHIQPEWYFLFAYAILRSIPNKLGGVLALLSSIMILYSILLLKHKNIKSSNQQPLLTIIWSLNTIFIILTWTGGKPAEDPFTNLSLIITTWYFITFLILFPTHTQSEIKNNKIPSKK